MTTQYDNSNDLAVDLAQFDDQYEQVQVSDRNAKVPDGKYTAKIDRAEIKKSQKGNLMLSWELMILGPTQVGRHLFRNNVMTGNETNLSILKTDLQTCGITLSKLSELPSRLNDLLDVVVEVQVKTKPAVVAGERDNQNVYLNKFVGKGDAGYQAAAASVESDIPF